MVKIRSVSFLFIFHIIRELFDHGTKLSSESFSTCCVKIILYLFFLAKLINTLTFLITQEIFQTK